MDNPIPAVLFRLVQEEITVTDQLLRGEFVTGIDHCQYANTHRYELVHCRSLMGYFEMLNAPANCLRDSQRSDMIGK